MQQGLVALRQAHAQAFVLRTLYRSIGIEQPRQQALRKGRRLPLHGNRDGLVAGRHSQFMREFQERRTGQPCLTASCHRALKAFEICTVRQRSCRSHGGPHDAVRPGGRESYRALPHGFQLRRPYRNHGLVGLEGSVTNQQTQQVTFCLRACTAPARKGPVVVQHNLIAQLQLRRLRPFHLQAVTGLARHAAHTMVCGKAQYMPLFGLQLQHGFGAGLEEALTRPGKRAHPPPLQTGALPSQPLAQALQWS